MNPKNPKGSSSLIPSAYQVLPNKDGFTFTTDSGIRYQLAFESNANDLPRTSFGENCVTFSIIPISGYVSAEAYKRQGDPMIETTITDLLKELFDKNPLLVINYSCDLDEELERHRSITFGRWYQSHLKPRGINRISHTNPTERVYAAALYREGNPYISEIKSFFSEIFMGK